MERVCLEIGSTAWIYEPGHKGERTPHKVVHVFDLMGLRQHVIEIDTPVDVILTIRDEFTVSDSADKPIGLWRGLWGLGRKAVLA